jgi:hypothetical protein
MHKVIELLVEALSEDAREASAKRADGFSADGFMAFFPEEDAEDIEQTWIEYASIRDRHKTLHQVIAEYAVIS